MKKSLFFIALALMATTHAVKAQMGSVGIGTTAPDASAKLDVVSTDRGLLAPRMSVVQRDAIAMPAKSLLIFNLTSNTYEYNSGTSAAPVWTPLASVGPNANAWSLTGNAGTIDGTNFLGTTDSVALNFRVNNLKAGRIGNADKNTSLGYQSLNAITNGINNSAFGFNALLKTTTANDNTAIGSYALTENTTGVGNTATGVGTLSNNTTGVGNMAVGQSALYSNISGNSNSGVGFQALNGNTTGSNNTATGVDALFTSTIGSSNTASGAAALFLNTTGHDNSALGYRALHDNTTGSNNLALGSAADVTVGNLSNATAIGYNAKVSTSNSLVLGGTGGDAVYVGIGTSSPTDVLDVRKFGRTRTITDADFISPSRSNFFFGDNDPSLGTNAFNTLHVMSKKGSNIALWGDSVSPSVLRFTSYKRSLTDENLATVASVYAIPYGNPNFPQGQLVFATRDNTAPGGAFSVPLPRMTIDSVGNVVVATPSQIGTTQFATDNQFKMRIYPDTTGLSVNGTIQSDLMLNSIRPTAGNLHRTFAIQDLYDGIQTFTLGTDSALNTLQVTGNQSIFFTTNGTAARYDMGFVPAGLGHANFGIGIGTGTGAASSYIMPTNKLHVIAAANPLRLEGLQTSNTNTIMTVDATGVVTQASATGAVAVPAGTTAQQPGTPAFGMIRYNTSIGRGEMYVNDVNGDGTQGDAGWRAF